MGWSPRVGYVFGIPVRLHLTLLLLLGWMALSGGQKDHADTTMPLLALGLFGCVFLHELGHAVAARGLGIRVIDITLLPIGGQSRLASVPRVPRHELLIAGAGPLVNFMLAGILYALHHALEAPPTNFSWVGTPDHYLLGKLSLLNLSLALFNLIPAFPLDGGRILRACLATVLPHLQATRITTGLGQGIALALALVGVMNNLAILLFVAFFLFVGAAEERARVQTQAFVEGVPVRDAMMTRFFTLARADSLRHAASLLLAGTQRDFPVMEGAEMVGILTRRRLIEAVRRAGESLYVCEAMEPAPVPVTPEDPLDRAVERLMAEGVPMLPVCSEEGLCGLLTPSGASEYVLLRSAQQRPERSAR